MGVSVTAWLVMVLVVFIHMIDVERSRRNKVPRYAEFDREQALEKALLLNEMDHVFDNRLVWVAETPAGLNFGLRQSDEEAIGESERLAVRVVVERRAVGDSAWKQFWAMDVMSRDQEFVSVSPREDTKQQLQLWAYRLPDGAIAVESTLQLSGDVSFLAESSGLYRDRTPQQVATTRDHEAEYRVFQSVAVLSREVI